MAAGEKGTDGMTYRVRLVDTNGGELDGFTASAGEDDLGREAMTAAVKHWIDSDNGILLNFGDRIEIEILEDPKTGMAVYCGECERNGRPPFHNYPAHGEKGRTA